MALLTARADSKYICKAAKSFWRETGRWPVSIAEVAQPTGPDGRRLKFHLERSPRDPWGNEYQLYVENGVVVVSSLGADGVAGGTGADSDSVYRETEDESAP